MAIDSAQRSVRVQVLSYGALENEGEGETAREVAWDELDAPLRRAAARGVHVELLVSHWALAPGSVEGLQSLAKVPNVRVRVLTVPEGEGGSGAAHR